MAMGGRGRDEGSEQSRKRESGDSGVGAGVGAISGTWGARHGRAQSGG